MNTELDRIDHGILQALTHDARLSNKELAARVGLAQSSCLERVRRLRERGVIRGFHAEVDSGALGLGLQAMVAVRLQEHSRAVFASFHDHALACQEVVAIYHVGGEEDFLLHVAVRDSDHLRDFAFDRLISRPEVVHIETSLIFEYAQSRALVAPD